MKVFHEKNSSQPLLRKARNAVKFSFYASQYRELLRSLYKIRQDFAPHGGVRRPKTTHLGRRSSALKCLHFNADIHNRPTPFVFSVPAFSKKNGFLPRKRENVLSSGDNFKRDVKIRLLSGGKCI